MRQNASVKYCGFVVSPHSCEEEINQNIKRKKSEVKWKNRKDRRIK